MATTRDLKLEQAAVDAFIKNQNRKPSTPDDWKAIHTSSYGTQLPPELASLDMYTQSSPTQTPTAPTPTSTPTPTTPVTGGASTNPTANLSYHGQDVSDSALKTASDSAFSYNTAGFLDKVKERLQQKFKPETETLGLGAFASTLGPLDPNGVIRGIDEKSTQFRRKGALALQALSTANDIYSEQAKRAADKLDYIEGLRSKYEAEQKDAEGQIQELALAIAKSGGDIPQDILALLPQKQLEGYKVLSQIFKAENARKAGSGGGGGGSNLAVGDSALDPYVYKNEETGKWEVARQNITDMVSMTKNERQDIFQRATAYATQLNEAEAEEAAKLEAQGTTETSPQFTFTPKTKGGKLLADVGSVLKTGAMEAIDRQRNSFKGKALESVLSWLNTPLD